MGTPANPQKVAPTAAPGPATVQECQQELLRQLKSGQAVISSADKEGYRTLCYHRHSFLFVAVGDEGTSALRLPTDEALLGYLWRDNNTKLVLENGTYRWSYDLTEAEQLANWQATLARLSPGTESTHQFVASVLRTVAGTELPQ